MREFLLSTLIILAFNLYTQDIEVTQRSFNLFGNSNYYISPDSSEYFNLRGRFVRGMHWENGDNTSAEYLDWHSRVVKFANFDRLNNHLTPENL
jgi:hypothetical protein